MKKGTCINIYVIMASVSHHQEKQNRLAGIDELIHKACNACEAFCQANAGEKPELTDEELQQLFA